MLRVRVDPSIVVCMVAGTVDIVGVKTIIGRER